MSGIFQGILIGVELTEEEEGGEKGTGIEVVSNQLPSSYEI